MGNRLKIRSEICSPHRDGSSPRSPVVSERWTVASHLCLLMSFSSRTSRAASPVQVMPSFLIATPPSNTSPMVVESTPLTADALAAMPNAKSAPSAPRSSTDAESPLSSDPAWFALGQMCQSADNTLGSEAEGSAGAHAHAAREEAAIRLIDNHANVLRDVCNPSDSLNIAGKTLTQLEHVHYADEALREVAVRLLGQRPGAHQLRVRLDPSDGAQVKTWRATCAYLDGRIESVTGEQPGGTTDMSPAAAAMRSVLAEVGAAGVTTTLEQSTPCWDALHQLLQQGTTGSFGSCARGAAGEHAHAAREEAAKKLIGNHATVLKDVCNPTQKDVRLGLPVTQPELKRVAPELVYYADEALREVAARLLGQRPGSHQLRVRLDPSREGQLSAWFCVTAYLDQRIRTRAMALTRTRSPATSCCEDVAALSRRPLTLAPLPADAHTTHAARARAGCARRVDGRREARTNPRHVPGRGGGDAQRPQGDVS